MVCEPHRSLHGSSLSAAAHSRPGLAELSSRHVRLQEHQAGRRVSEQRHVQRVLHFPVFALRLNSLLRLGMDLGEGHRRVCRATLHGGREASQRGGNQRDVHSESECVSRRARADHHEDHGRVRALRVFLQASRRAWRHGERDLRRSKLVLARRRDLRRPLPRGRVVYDHSTWPRLFSVLESHRPRALYR